MIPSAAPFRKKTNWLVALAVEAVSPAMRFYARHRINVSRLPPPQWKRALILGDNHIGDLLYRTCSLRALKAGLPECDFYYLAAANTADILAGNPFLKAVLPWARSDSPLDLSPEHMNKLKELRFDAALCTNCIRYWPELLLAIRVGIPNRAGYTYKGFSGWVTHPIPIRYPQPFPAYFQGYVAALTSQVITGPPQPELYVSALAEEEAGNAFRRLGLADTGPVIAFFLTSRQETSLWPLENYHALFKLISQRPIAKLVLLGSQGDRVLLEETAGRMKPGLCVPVCTELSLSGMAAFVRRCTLAVVKDSGPRHIANAVRTPVLFFRSTSYSQVEAGRYCPNERDLTPPGEFLTARRQQSLLAHIEPAKVLQQIEQVLKSEGR